MASIFFSLLNLTLSLDPLNFGLTYEGGGFGKTLLLKNIVGLWPLQESKRYWHLHGNNYSYEQLAELVKGIGFVNAWINLENEGSLKFGNMPEKKFYRLYNLLNKIQKQILNF